MSFSESEISSSVSSPSFSKALEKDGELTEDDISDSEKDIQDITSKYIKLVDDSLAAKEKDLLTI